MTPLLELDGVGKRFAGSGGITVACEDVSLSVAPGEVVGLVGESGSGKSTLANLVLGLHEPDAGEVRFDGRPVGTWLREDQRRFRSAVQAVFQQPLLALDGRRTVRWSIAEPLVVHRVGDRRSRHERVDELLAAVGLGPDLADRRPRQLSGGQLQRVNIARALALQPRLLVCDEPVSALDVSVQAQVINLLLDIQDRFGTAFLFVSHDLAVVRHVSDRIAVMYAGRIVETGPADDLCAQPHHPYTRALLAAAPDLRADHCVVPLLPREGLPSRGCAFAPRCPWAEDQCRDQPPPLRPFGQDRLVACRRAGDLRAAPAAGAESVAESGMPSGKT
jgi:oligopeptide/dipeptide ABC transporter ATP-binding protein